LLEGFSSSAGYWNDDPLVPPLPLADDRAASALRTCLNRFERG
jgi:hypothetical protein